MATTAMVPSSERGLKKLAKYAISMKSKAGKAREKTEAMTGQVVSGAVHAGIGGLVAAVEQKCGSRPIANLDAPVIGLVGFGAAALFGIAGKYNDHLYDAAKTCAAIAAYKAVKRNVKLSASALASNKGAGVKDMTGGELDDDIRDLRG